MKKTITLFAILCVALVCQAQSLKVAMVNQYATNLLTNPSFENWTGGNSDGWTIVSPANGAVSENTVIIANGIKSLKVTGGTGTYSINQLIPVVAGKTYHLQMKYYIETGDGTDARIWCNFKNSQGSYWKMNLTDSLALKGPNWASVPGYFPDVRNTWQTYTYDVLAPTGYEYFSFEFRTYRNPAVVYWDDLYFGEVTTTDVQAPSIPTGLSNSTLSPYSFFLSWNASTDNVGVVGYDVYKDGELYDSTSLTGINITELIANTSYSMTVLAKDAAGNKSVVSVPLVISTSDIGKPGKPTGETHSCLSTAYQYTTTGATNATSYNWWVEPPFAGTITGTGTTASVTWNSTYNGNAYVVVQGIRSDCVSDTCALTVLINNASVPTPFSLVAPSNGVWSTATPLFQWAASTGASTYSLYIDGILKNGNITTTSYQEDSTEAISSGMHTWNVIASNGCTAESNETWSFRVDATQPTAFSLVSPADNSWTANLQPTFSWGASSDVNSGLAKYQLWIDGILNRDNIASTATSSTPTTNLSNGSHTWEIRALDNVGNVRNSTQIWTVKVDNFPPISTRANSNYLRFNGSSNYVVIPNSSSLNITNQKLTIEAWVNISSYKDWASVVTKGLNNSDYALRQHGGKINFSSQDYSGYDGNSIIPLNTWTHIAVTYDGTNIIFYLNGIYDGSAVVSNYIHNYSESLYIGADFPTIDEYWNGNLDEIRIWNCARTQAEIISYKNVPLTGTESSLSGYWRFNEGSGIIANDETIYHNVGAINGAIYQVAQLSASGALCNLKTPANNQYLVSTTPSIAWNSTQDSGIGFQKFQLYIDGNMVKDNLSDSTWTVTTPLTYGVHTWYVKGFDLLGNNQSSYSRTFYIDNSRPNAFNLTSPTNNQIVNLPTPNLTWQASSDSTGGCGLRKYQLLINGVVNRDSISITQTTVAPKNALAQGLYTWAIKAYDNVGNVRQSTQTNTFYVDWEDPTDFTLITPLDNSTLTVAKPEFKWHKSNDVGSGISKYELNITGQTPITILASDTSKTITSNLPNGPYTWYVKAYDVAGGFTSSNTQTFTISATVSEVEQTELNNSIKVYPNPVGNELFIESDKNERTNFEILNSIGQLVYKGILLDKIVVQTSDFNSGIYIVKLENGKTYEFKKILKK